MTGLFRTVKGYVKIMLVSDTPERFINYCYTNGISVWNIKRHKDGMSLCISIFDYKNMRQHRTKSDRSMKVRLISKHGLPISVSKMLRRPGMCVGVLIFVAINVLLSHNIWLIDVKGNSSIEREDVLAACNELGIYAGCKISDIDTYDASQKLALKFSNVAWLSLNIEGSKLTVNISEAAHEEKTETGKPGNIVASYDGVIRYIEASSGVKTVKVGQAVQKGQLLVSGVQENKENTHFVAAQGKIIAETTREYTVAIEKNYSYCEIGGSEGNRSVLEFFGVKIPLYLADVGTDAVSVGVRSGYLELFGVSLPVGITERQYVDIYYQDIVLAQEQAVNRALQYVQSELRDLEINEVLSHDATVTEKSDCFSIKIKLTCLEEIGEYVEIELESD